MDPRTPATSLVSVLVSVSVSVSVTTRDALADQLVRAGNGDQTAFAVVHDEVAGRVYGMALRVLRDADLARDAAADTFVEIWARASEFQPARGSALGWVMTLAHRRAVERARSVVVEAGNAHADAPGHAADLTCLPETERRAIELAYFHGATNAGSPTSRRHRWTPPGPRSARHSCAWVSTSVRSGRPAPDRGETCLHRLHAPSGVVAGWSHEHSRADAGRFRADRVG